MQAALFPRFPPSSSEVDDLANVVCDAELHHAEAEVRGGQTAADRKTSVINTRDSAFDCSKHKVKAVEHKSSAFDCNRDTSMLFVRTALRSFKIPDPCDNTLSLRACQLCLKSHSCVQSSFLALGSWPRVPHR